MGRKKSAFGAAPVASDDAPELTDEWFAGAELYNGRERVRQGTASDADVERLRVGIEDAYRRMTKAGKELEQALKLKDLATSVTTKETFRRKADAALHEYEQWGKQVKQLKRVLSSSLPA